MLERYRGGEPSNASAFVEGLPDGAADAFTAWNVFTTLLQEALALKGDNVAGWACVVHAAFRKLPARFAGQKLPWNARV